MMSKNMTSTEMLEKLVGFDTISTQSNLNLIHWVRDYLDGFGIESTLIHDEAEGKANLHAIIGRDDRAGIVLSGHTDVVPVEGQAWDSDPFALRQHDGHLYGRGTCDMKGFIASVLAKVPDMVAADMQTPVHFAFSYDEELGCLGAHKLVAHLDTLDIRPKMCIVGEPTGMKPITGHKGICDFDCTVRGREAHSSLAPYAVNAVEAAAELVAYIKSVARRMQSEGPFNKQYDPPFTTLHTGMFHGGTALNIVPQHCAFSFEIRNIPDVDVDALIDEIRQYAFKTIEPRMKDIDPTCGFDIKPAAWVPAFDMPADDPAVAFVQSLSGSNSTEKVSFATEAGIYQSKQIPTVVCGPGFIAQAHKPNEFVSVEQMIKCDHFIDRLVQQCQNGL